MAPNVAANRGRLRTTQHPPAFVKPSEMTIFKGVKINNDNKKTYLWLDYARVIPWWWWGGGGTIGSGEGGVEQR